MATSLKKVNKAYSLLEVYQGKNPFLKLLYNGVYVKKDKVLSDFEIDYIIKNIDFQPEPINKVIKVAKWFTEKNYEKWNVSFIPEKLQVIEIIGETDTCIHVQMNCKQNQQKPIMCFIPKKALLDDLRITDYNDIDVNFDWYDQKCMERHGFPMWDHQKTGVKFLLARKKCILADDPGTAKTGTSVVAAIEGGFKKVLIITTASLKSTWVRELTTFVDKDDIEVVFSTNWNGDKKYTIFNYDILNNFYTVPTETYTETKILRDKYGNILLDENGNQKTKTVTKKAKSRKKSVQEEALSNSKLYQENFDLVIIDECHKLSKKGSIKYDVIYDFLTRSKIENVYLLTGTPMTNRPINLYYVLLLIQHEITKDYDYFVTRYCGGKKIFNRQLNREILLTGGATNLEELSEKIKNSYIRRLKKDIPGMIGKELHEIYYDLTPEEREEYEQLWEEYENAQYDLGKTELNKELTEGIILRQFTSKAMVKRTIAFANDFIEDDQKVFITCCFDNEIDALKEYYGDKAVVYRGGMTNKQKDKAESEFMNNKKVMVFIGNLLAAGVGLSLVVSNICIYNSFNYVPSDVIQVQDRINRLNSTKKAEVYFQLFNDTISENVYQTVIKKSMNIDATIKPENQKSS